jgi:hypothetical protein
LNGLAAICPSNIGSRNLKRVLTVRDLGRVDRPTRLASKRAWLKIRKRGTDFGTRSSRLACKRPTRNLRVEGPEASTRIGGVDHKGALTAVPASARERTPDLIDGRRHEIVHFERERSPSNRLKAGHALITRAGGAE